ncbi:MAG TPA: glycosyltransferase family 39 protein [Gaiellaceae bacterium]
MTRRQEWGALAALVLVSAGFRAWAALDVPVPWITPDEMVYSLLGRGLYEHGSLDILGGPTPFYSFLTPVFAGLPLSVLDLATGYDVLHGLQALVMSLAAVPAYLWARTIVSRRSALVVAALTLAVPGLTYAGLVMTEVLFYPLLVLAAWAAAEAIARPTRRTQALLVVAVAAASATRLQAIALLPAFATAALLDAAIARS